MFKEECEAIFQDMMDFFLPVFIEKLPPTCVHPDTNNYECKHCFIYTTSNKQDMLHHVAYCMIRTSIPNPVAFMHFVVKMSLSSQRINERLHAYIQHIFDRLLLNHVFLLSLIPNDICFKLLFQQMGYVSEENESSLLMNYLQLKYHGAAEEHIIMNVCLADNVFGFFVNIQRAPTYYKRLVMCTGAIKIFEHVFGTIHEDDVFGVKVLVERFTTWRSCMVSEDYYEAGMLECEILSFIHSHNLTMTDDKIVDYLDIYIDGCSSFINNYQPKLNEEYRSAQLQVDLYPHY